MENNYIIIKNIYSLTSDMKEEYQRNHLFNLYDLNKLVNLVHSNEYSIKDINDEKIQTHWSLLIRRLNRLDSAKDDDRFLKCLYLEEISGINREAKKIMDILFDSLSPDVRFGEICENISKLSSSYSEDDSGALSGKEVFLLVTKMNLQNYYDQLISVYRELVDDTLKPVVYQIGLKIDLFLNSNTHGEGLIDECVECVDEIKEIASGYLKEKGLKL